MNKINTCNLESASIFLLARNINEEAKHSDVHTHLLNEMIFPSRTAAGRAEQNVVRNELG